MDGHTFIETANFIDKTSFVDIATLIVAFAAFCTAICYFLFEEFHRRKDAEPRCKIVERYHDDNIAVTIVNRGSGCLIIDSVEVRKNGITKNDLISFMPRLKQYWRGYSLEISGRDLLPNEEVVLCAICPKNHFARVKVLRALADIEICVTYHSGHSKKKRKISKQLVYPHHFLQNRDYKIKGE